MRSHTTDSRDNGTEMSTEVIYRLGMSGQGIEGLTKPMSSAAGLSFRYSQNIKITLFFCHMYQHCLNIDSDKGSHNA